MRSVSIGKLAIGKSSGLRDGLRCHRGVIGRGVAASVRGIWHESQCHSPLVRGERLVRRHLYLGWMAPDIDVR